MLRHISPGYVRYEQAKGQLEYLQERDVVVAPVVVVAGGSTVAITTIC